MLKFICQILAQSDKVDIDLFVRHPCYRWFYKLHNRYHQQVANPNFDNVVFLLMTIMYKRNIRGPEKHKGTQHCPLGALQR